MDGQGIGSMASGMRGAVVSEVVGHGQAGLLPARAERQREGSGEQADCGRECATQERRTKLDVSFVIPGEPKGKGRARSRIAKGKGGAQFVSHYTPNGTVEYENLVRLSASEAMAGEAPTCHPCRVTVHAFCAVPASWSQKKRRRALSGEIFPTGKPDLDNIEKSVLDGMNQIVFRDDSVVCAVLKSKHYSATPRVEVRVHELDGEAANGKR